MEKIKLEDLPQDLQKMLKRDEYLSICESKYQPDVVCEDDDVWEDQGKYSTKTITFKYEDKHYYASYRRDGNYFSGYDIELENEEFTEVRLKSRTVQYYG